jgi:hypothetical protein
LDSDNHQQLEMQMHVDNCGMSESREVVLVAADQIGPSFRSKQQGSSGSMTKWQRWGRFIVVSSIWILTGSHSICFPGQNVDALLRAIEGGPEVQTE